VEKRKPSAVESYSVCSFWMCMGC